MAPAANPMNDKSIPDISTPADHTWKYDKKIGAGSEGTAHLWCLLNTDHKTVRRIVIKRREKTNTLPLPLPTPPRLARSAKPQQHQLLFSNVQDSLESSRQDSN